MNKRQEYILKHMYADHNYLSSKEISALYNVSLRTAQSDLKAIVDYLKVNMIEFSYNKDLGYKILSKMESNINNDNSQSLLRVKYILCNLFFAKDYIKVEKLANELYVSYTTLNNDLKAVKSIISKYNLKLNSKPYYGSKIIGSEKDKRICIISEKLIAFHDENAIYNRNNYFDSNLFSDVSTIVSNVLITHKFNISDNEFQNFLLTTYLSVSRSINGFFLDKDIDENIKSNNAYEVSKEIQLKVSDRYNFPCSKAEILYLTSSICGKNSLITNQIIPKDIEEHVSNILTLINEKLEIDLSYSIELRVALSLHLMPLLERIKSNNQIIEVPCGNIHNDYSYSFELAIISAKYIEELTDSHLTEAELTYLAVHYTVILNKDGNQKTRKNILFICSSRRSDSLLIKSAIYNHFPNKINQINVKNKYELSGLDFDKYDVIFSTLLNDDSIPKNAIKVNRFLTDNDYRAIEFALDNGSIFKMIETLFSKKRFIVHLKAIEKNEVIEKLASLSSGLIDSKQLYKAVISREQNGFTSYGNLIALPHPEHLLSDTSFCSVALLDKPIIWSEENKAQIIILCCASKSFGNDLQMLFNFISLLFNDSNRVQKIINEQSYESFIECLKSLQHSCNN